MTEQQLLSTLQELFPNYSSDILSGILETENFSLNSAIDSVMRLEAEAPTPPTSLRADFLEAETDDIDPRTLAAEAASMQLAEEIAMQEQLEKIILESRQEAKRGATTNWKQKLKNVFKRKAKHLHEPTNIAVIEQSEEPAVAIDDDDDEVISFKTTDDDKLVRGERYPQVRPEEERDGTEQNRQK